VDARDPGAPPRPKWDTSIQLISTGGGAPLRLPSGAARGLTWSPRGDEIVYGSAGGRIRIIRTDGSKARPFFARPQTQGFAGSTWSPDGTHIGFCGHVRHGPWYNGIYVADADGRNLHLLTSRAYNEYGFAWSPDGRNILYGREDRGGTYVIGADGRNDHRLTRDWPTQSLFPTLTWAPSGRSVAYATDRTGNGDIYVIGADGRNKVRLTSSPAHDGSPSWQP
jgi:TolB protein